jgi:teichuronic acid biosynthesis glycosyltransferase TuaH
MKPIDYDIVMLALPRWDGLYSSTAYSLAKELSRHTRVFYIDNPFTWKDFLTARNSAQIKRRRNALLHGRDESTVPDPNYPNLVAVTPKLTLPINWLPAGGVYSMLSHVNDKILFSAIRKMLDRFNVKKFVFINSFNPLFGNFLPDGFTPILRIYQSVDDISKSEYISKHGTRLEKEAVRNAGITLVTSKELERLMRQYSSKVFYLPNAADIELFSTALTRDYPRPEEMRKIPEGRKVIFYMGNICHRIDYGLLRKIADHHHEKHLVLVGPVTNESYIKAGLDKLPNVIFTGRKSLEQLPAYLRFADCCIIPFLCNQLTRSIYPLKINEYLAAGKPVVTTNFSEDIANFAGVAFVSASHDEFVHNISKAVEEDSGDKVRERTECASGNNWKSRADTLLEIINSESK